MNVEFLLSEEQQLIRDAARDFSRRVVAPRAMPGARWFEPAKLNYAEHVFRGKPDSGLALQHASELRALGSDQLKLGALTHCPNERPVGSGLGAHVRALPFGVHHACALTCTVAGGGGRIQVRRWDARRHRRWISADWRTDR